MNCDRMLRPMSLCGSGITRGHRSDAFFGKGIHDFSARDALLPNPSNLTSEIARTRNRDRYAHEFSDASRSSFASSAVTRCKALITRSRFDDRAQLHTISDHMTRQCRKSDADCRKRLLTKLVTLPLLNR